jgi:molybdopterin/thiamine biosynthesis adenylyltransferase/rhodanese-related sulfurtransferase
MLNSQQYERYSRQVSLAEIAEAGQSKLLQAKVLVIGAGGLGCPILQYLTAAGVGHIGIADDDVVSLSNLHRQILYGFDDIGKPKATIAAQRLTELNADVEFFIFQIRITNANAWEIINGFDIVVDGSDNFETRYLVNDACVLLNKPLVYGSVFRFEGQVSVFNVNGSVNYRDVFAEPPAIGEVPDCSEAGVLGVLPGIIGNLMANETIKLITKAGMLLTNKLLSYNSLNNSFYEILLEAGTNKNVAIPGNRAEFENMNYALSCAFDPASIEIDAEQFNSLILTRQVNIVDVREPGEQPFIEEFSHQNIPLSEFKSQQTFTWDAAEQVVFFCQSGKRSLEAAMLLKESNPQLSVLSLKGGIAKWKSGRFQLTQ